MWGGPLWAAALLSVASMKAEYYDGDLQDNRPTLKPLRADLQDNRPTLKPLRADLQDNRPTLRPQRACPDRPLPRGRMCRILDHCLAEPCQFPHMALVRPDLDSLVIGGSLITPTAVLTLASAIVGYKKWSIVLGIIHRSDHNKNGIPWSIISTWGIPHPSYNTTNKYNNIGVIMLPRKAPIGKCIKPVALPSMEEVSESFAGQTALVSGWGCNPNTTSESDILIFSEVVILANEFFDNHESRLYAGNENRVVTEGDMGDPLVIRTDKGFKQVGVAAFWVVGSGTITYPGGYTRVTYYLEWIRRIASNAIFL